MNINFSVQAGKTVYLGRLLVEFPPGLLMAGTRVRTVVEDARESTLETARQKSGLSLGDVITDLMVRGLTTGPWLPQPPKGSRRRRRPR